MLDRILKRDRSRNRTSVFDGFVFGGKRGGINTFRKSRLPPSIFKNVIKNWRGLAYAIMSVGAWRNGLVATRTLIGVPL